MSRPGCGYWNSQDLDVASAIDWQRYVTASEVTTVRRRLDVPGQPPAAKIGFLSDPVAFPLVSQVDPGALVVGYSGTALAVAGGPGEREAW
jgi:hypothetical protein